MSAVVTHEELNKVVDHLNANIAGTANNLQANIINTAHNLQENQNGLQDQISKIESIPDPSELDGDFNTNWYKFPGSTMFGSATNTEPAIILPWLRKEDAPAPFNKADNLQIGSEDFAIDYDCLKSLYFEIWDIYGAGMDAHLWLDRICQGQYFQAGLGNCPGTIVAQMWLNGLLNFEDKYYLEAGGNLTVNKNNDPGFFSNIDAVNALHDHGELYRKEMKMGVDLLNNVLDARNPKKSPYEMIDSNGNVIPSTGITPYSELMNATVKLDTASQLAIDNCPDDAKLTALEIGNALFISLVGCSKFDHLTGCGSMPYRPTLMFADMLPTHARWMASCMKIDPKDVPVDGAGTGIPELQNVTNLAQIPDVLAPYVTLPDGRGMYGVFWQAMVAYKKMTSRSPDQLISTDPVPEYPSFVNNKVHVPDYFTNPKPFDLSNQIQPPDIYHYGCELQLVRSPLFSWFAKANEPDIDFEWLDTEFAGTYTLAATPNCPGTSVILMWLLDLIDVTDPVYLRSGYGGVVGADIINKRVPPGFLARADVVKALGMYQLIYLKERELGADLLAEPNNWTHLRLYQTSKNWDVLDYATLDEYNTIRTENFDGDYPVDYVSTYHLNIINTQYPHLKISIPEITQLVQDSIAGAHALDAICDLDPGQWQPSISLTRMMLNHAAWVARACGFEPEDIPLDVSMYPHWTGNNIPTVNDYVKTEGMKGRTRDPFFPMCVAIEQSIKAKYAQPQDRTSTEGRRLIDYHLKQ